MNAWTGTDMPSLNSPATKKDRAKAMLIEEWVYQLLRDYEQPTREQRIHSITEACELSEGMSVLVHAFIEDRFKAMRLDALNLSQLAEVAEFCKGLAVEQEKSRPPKLSHAPDVVEIRGYLGRK